MSATRPLPGQGNNSFAISLALLLIRIALAWVFIFHGAQKVFGAFDGPGMDKFIQGMTAMNLPLLPPAAWAWMAALGEFLGGVFIGIGLLSRLASLPLIVTMLVAIATVHGKNGFSSQHGGYEYNMVLAAMSGAILLAGPGLLSIDAFIFRKGFYSCGAQPLDNPTTREALTK